MAEPVQLSVVVREHTDVSKIRDVDSLLTRITDAFSTEEQRQFITHFYMYQRYDSVDDYVVDLDKIWEWLGFARRDPAKRTLINNFDEGADYRVSHSAVTNSLGGRPKEVLMMNIDTFKQLCFLAKTPKAQEVRMYYLKLEKVMMDVIQAERAKFIQDNKELQEKLDQVATRKNNKKGFVYIACNLKEIDQGIFKVGRSTNVIKRHVSLNTSEKDDAFAYQKCVPTLNCHLAEDILHAILDDRKCRYNREFFRIDLNRLILLVHCVTGFVDTLCDHEDDMNQAYEAMKAKVCAVMEAPPSVAGIGGTPIMVTTTNNDSHNVNIINVNVSCLPGLNTKYLSSEVYQRFVDECLRADPTAITWTEELLKAVDKWTRRNNIQFNDTIRGGSESSYFYQKGFKDEVISVVQRLFESKEDRHAKGPRLSRNNKGPRGRGFRGVRLTPCE